LLDVAVLALLLLFSALFSGTETALFSLQDGDLARLRRRGSPADRHVLRLLTDPPRLLAALLIGNLLVNIGVSVLGTSLLLERFGQRGLAIAVPALTVLVLLVGEITPKLIALRLGPSLARLLQAPLRVWVAVIRPVLDLNGLITRRALARLPFDRTGSRPLTVPELITAVDMAVHDASLTETEGRFVSRLLTLDGLEVREIMRPRPDVVSLELGQSRAELLEIARDAGLNRYPVVAPGRNLPVGVLHLKDLLGKADDAVLEAAMLRAPVFVPESKSVSVLMHELRVDGGHMAFVLDEHGDFAGLVTLEDCLESLTGPWLDESDTGDPEILAVGDRNWIVAGVTDLRQVRETCGAPFEPSRDYVTLAGFVMAKLGRIPARGDRVVWDRYRCTVLEMDGLRVTKLRLQRLPRSMPEGTP
jgi:putative hemolysin